MVGIGLHDVHRTVPVCKIYNCLGARSADNVAVSGGWRQWGKGFWSQYRCSGATTQGKRPIHSLQRLLICLFRALLTRNIVGHYYAVFEMLPYQTLVINKIKFAFGSACHCQGIVFLVLIAACWNDWYRAQPYTAPYDHKRTKIVENTSSQLH
jgi:hypothetical protein